MPAGAVELLRQLHLHGFRGRTSRGASRDVRGAVERHKDLASAAAPAIRGGISMSVPLVSTSQAHELDLRASRPLASATYRSVA